LDLLIAMDTESFNIDGIGGLPNRTFTYDDGTFAVFLRHPDSDVSRAGISPRAVERWIRRQSRACRTATVCCVSTEWAARSVAADYEVAANRIAVVGMGHRPRAVPAVGERDWSSPRYLFVGVDWGRKNGQAVLRAFAAVRERYPSATLSLVGAHPDVAQEGVIGYGMLRREDAAAQATLDRLYATSTAFVLPSRFDPSPIAYLEAASAGLPVIATTEGGAGELLGEGALSVHPDDDEGLIIAMVRLADPDCAQQLGDTARRMATDASWQRVARRIADRAGI
jgi:glycosyltransferase involved in cell wall biosynthesis